MSKIDSYIEVLGKINKNESVSFEEINELNGTGAFKFLLHDWNDKSTWGVTNSKFFDKTTEFANEIKKMSDNKGIKYDVLVNEIKNSISTSFFTPQEVVDTLVKNVAEVFERNQRKGYRPSILEPSAGTGRFVYSLSKHVPDADIKAIEKSYFTSLLLKEGINNLNSNNESNYKGLFKGFEEVKKEEKYDLLISNIPFGNVAITDNAPNLDKYKSKIHNYFFAKGVDHLKHNGLIIFLTSTSILDSRSNELKEHLFSKCDIVDSIRLPNNIFKSENTEVVSDIIILQKNDNKKQLTRKDKQLLELKEPTLFDNLVYNQYFENNPTKVLGEFTQGGMYGDDGFSVQNDNSITDICADLDLLLKESFSKLKTISLTNEKQLVEEIEIHQKVFNNDDTLRTGSLIILDNEVYRLGKKVNRITNEYYVDILPFENQNKIISYISLRNKLLSFNKESDAEREQLNMLYDTFVSNYGFIKDNHIDDNDFSLIRGLEVVENNSVRKADIFFNNESINETLDIRAAVSKSLSNYAYINLNYISELTKESIDTIARTGIEEDIFRYEIGSTENQANIVMKNEFLSGDVRLKAQNIEEMLLSGKERPSYILEENLRSSLDELKLIFPRNLKVADLEPQVGDLSVSCEVYSDFFEKFAGAKKGSINIFRDEDNYKYVVTIDGWNNEIEKAFSINRIGRGTFKADFSMVSLLLNTQKFFTFKNADGKTLTDHQANLDYQKLTDNVKTSWKKYLRENVDVAEKIENYYNNINRFVLKKYDGSYLDFSKTEETTGFTIRDFQKNAVARFIENNGGLADHVVGAGKTIVMIETAIRAKEAKLINKPMIVALKANTEEIYMTAKRLYPNKKILYADKNSYGTSKREEFFAKIAHNDYDLIVMTQPQFESIPLNKQAEIDITENELAMCISNIKLHKGTTNTYSRTIREEAGLIIKREKLENQLEHLRGSTDNLSIDIVKMGVDHILMDEAHLYKNLDITSVHDNIAGINKKGSQRAMKLYIHLRAIKDNFYGGEDKGFTFLSATPMLNSIAEMYTIQRLMSHNTLVKENISNFDAWINRYGVISTDMEMTVAGNFAFRPRLREFKKVNLLMKSYNKFADYVSSEMLSSVADNKPRAEKIINEIEKNEAQKQYFFDVITFANSGMRKLINRNPNREYAETEINILSATYSEMASIDMRLIDPSIYRDYDDEKNSKISKVVENVIKIYTEENEKKGTQIIFCDKGTPKSDASEEKFNLYEAIKRRLIREGVGENEIAFIHDVGDSESKKEKLFKAVNDGVVRVIIGSTEKLGTGVNIQKRLKACHHIDVKWRPADFEQRNGRVERPGNTYKDVQLHYYVTKDTLDAFKFEVCKHKDIFLKQLKNCKDNDFNLLDNHDGGGDNIGYADLVASITGNAVIKEYCLACKEYENINTLYQTFINKKQGFNSIISNTGENIKQINSKLDYFNEVKTIYDGMDKENIFYLVGDKKYNERDFGEFVLNKKSDIESSAIYNPRTEIATFNGNENLKICLYCSQVGDVTMSTEYFTDNKFKWKFSYNYGQIAKNIDTIGKSCIKTMENLPLGINLWESKIATHKEEYSRATEQTKEFTRDKYDELELKRKEIYDKKEDLKIRTEKEKSIILNADGRVRFIDLVENDMTFNEFSQVHHGKVVNETKDIKNEGFTSQKIQFSISLKDVINKIEYNDDITKINEVNNKIKL